MEKNKSKESKSPENEPGNSAPKAAESSVKTVEKSADQIAWEQKQEADQKAAEEAAEAKKEAEKKQKAYEKSKKIPVLKQDRGSYVPQPGTENQYHAKIERRSFDPLTGERQSFPSIQVFPPKAFDAFAKNSAGLGYHVDVLHDPTGDYPEVGMAVAIKEAKKKQAEKEKAAKK